jgi:hypothetical protein
VETMIAPLNMRALFIRKQYGTPYIYFISMQSSCV